VARAADRAGGGAVSRRATARYMTGMRPSAALLLAALAFAPGLSAAVPSAHVADDYARALVEAKARKVPIFVDAWAPW
jgi:hypothetical protein